MSAHFHPTIRLALLILVALTTTYTEGAVVSLFDGKTLDGWEGNRVIRCKCCSNDSRII
jgi:hypothetical protein